MGRHPSHGAPSFRFNAPEVTEMENILREHAGQVPNRDFLVSLATKFSNSPDRVGKTVVQVKQVWNWFQNRRYALRAKSVKSPGNPNAPQNPQGEAAPVRNVPPVAPQQAQAPGPAAAPAPLGHNLVRNASENPPMEFEAKSARDGAWYDVQEFLSHRNFETDDPEVFVRFAGFGQEEDEWVDVNKHVRHRSLPCESTECVIVIPGDLILCFQEGKEQALYFDAHVLDVQRRRHDLRGCRCRFLVRYDHDQSEEIVPLRKICRRPETDYRLQLVTTSNESAAASSSVADSKRLAVDPASSSSLRVPNPSANPVANPVAFPSHTILNPLAGAPHPVTTSTPAPSLITTPSQHLTPGSAQAPTPVLDLAPAQTQASAPAPALAPPQAQAPPPVLAAAPSQASALMQTPALAPAQVPDLAPQGAPASASTTTPSLTPMAAPTPSSIVVSAPTQSPTPNPSPDPTLNAIAAPTLTPAVVSGSTLVTAPSPSPTQILAPTSTTFPVRAPDAKNTESDSPASAFAGESLTREIIMNPSGASMVMEGKKEEISIPVTSTIVTGGSSVMQGETNENQVSPGKVESIIGEPMNLSTAPMEDGQSVSTMAE